VREDLVLRSLAAHLDREFLSLDGFELHRRAVDGQLTPDDMPLAFAKVRAIVAPPAEPAINRPQLEKQSRELAAKIDKARRNLALVDADNITAVQDEIKRMTADKDALDAQLAKRPPSDQDINKITLDVLDALWFMAIYFRTAAGDDSGDEPWAMVTIACGGQDAIRQECRVALRRITGITVHTTISGGKRTRHWFDRGEIAFRVDGVIAGKDHPFVRRYLAHQCGAGPSAL
jgi:hypothetical protein